MCYFITVIGEKGLDLNHLNKIGDPYQLVFDVCKNDFVSRQLGPLKLYLKKISSNCDCGTNLGQLKRKQVGIEEKELVKLRKQGWSESKINRWKAQRLKDIEKNSKKPNNQPEDSENWINFLMSLSEEKVARPFGLLLHWCKGILEEEPIEIKGQEILKIKEIDQVTLMNIEENMIYYFK